MNSVSHDEPEHLKLLQQLKNSFSTVYMTLLSIIQGVALADLVGVVSANYAQFTFVHWLLVLAMFGLIVTIWNQLMIEAISVVWVPAFGDSARTFLVGALELLLNHLIPLNLSIWLFLLAGVFVLEVLGVEFFRRKVISEDENKKLWGLLLRYRRPYILHGTGGITLFLILGLVESFSAADGVHELLAVFAGVFAVGWIAGLTCISIMYWRSVVKYAHNG